MTITTAGGRVMTATKEAYLAAYRVRVLAGYHWAREAEKLERFMDAARRTIFTDFCLCFGGGINDQIRDDPAD